MNNISVSRILITTIPVVLILIQITSLDVYAQSSQTFFLNLSMPKEYINYTISNKNGLYWAKVKGAYPIKILNSTNSQINLPMVYPTPPNTTNIHITLNGRELIWSNYTQTYPKTLHHTAIGDWSMVQCLIENVTDFFLLEIQYEHPIQLIDGSHTFLYDLNISPYLSTQSPNSTVYFTINFETAISNLQISTTQTETKWNTIDYYSVENNSATIITTQIDSNYLEPLQGDFVVSFNAQSSLKIPNFLLLSSLAVTSTLALGIFAYSKQKRKA
jgi:hypothetical protein